MTDQPKILVIDDTQRIRRIVRFSLQKAGYRVVLVSSGQQGLDQATAPNPPDLIILDIMMPQMDGYEVISRLKENPATCNIPVLFLSAKSQKKDITRGLEAGASDFLSKPFDLNVLNQKVAALIAGRKSGSGSCPAPRKNGGRTVESSSVPPSNPTAPALPPSLSAQKNLPGRDLSTIMMTDIVGFSLGMEEDEENTYLKLLKHNEIIRSAITHHQGEEIKTIGDAFLIRFREPLKGVRAAIEIQERLAAYNRHKDLTQRILIRIGIHIGDIMITEDDVFGTGVNIASRIESVAEPGTIYFSADVFRKVQTDLRIRVDPMGPTHLKNIKDPVALYRICLE